MTLSVPGLAGQPLILGHRGAAGHLPEHTRSGYILAIAAGADVVMVGSLIGMSLPFALSKFRLDPATASGPLVTSIADVAGVLVYFGIASVVLGS